MMRLDDNRPWSTKMARANGCIYCCEAADSREHWLPRGLVNVKGMHLLKGASAARAMGSSDENWTRNWRARDRPTSMGQRTGSRVGAPIRW